MDTTFMNFENSKTSDPHRLLINLSGVINMLLYQVLAFVIYGKKLKKSYKYNRFKISAPTLN